ncbi:hypothetical protein RRG08_034749 [Elysia crispata]|uniref:Uncharacterized protein n=1 Tax=Elysia crispata TaxID=231223 RepID=A0AAE0Y2P2_9GAST|nr:hypothetical protein RRG08_034749 [Elysia crispata]
MPDAMLDRGSVKVVPRHGQSFRAFCTASHPRQPVLLSQAKVYGVLQPLGWPSRGHQSLILRPSRPWFPRLQNCTPSPGRWPLNIYPSISSIAYISHVGQIVILPCVISPCQPRILRPSTWDPSAIIKRRLPSFSQTPLPKIGRSKINSLWSSEVTGDSLVSIC